MRLLAISLPLILRQPYRKRKTRTLEPGTSTAPEKICKKPHNFLHNPNLSFSFSPSLVAILCLNVGSVQEVSQRVHHHFLHARIQSLVAVCHVELVPGSEALVNTKKKTQKTQRNPKNPQGVGEGEIKYGGGGK